MLPVSNISPYAKTTQTRLRAPSNIYFQGTCKKSQKPSTPPPENEEEKPQSRFWEKAKSLEPFTRLKNGFSTVIDLFRPANIGNTIKREIIYTGALTLMSLFMGPLAIAAIPAYLGIGLAWDVCSAFMHGIMAPTNTQPPANAA